MPKYIILFFWVTLLFAACSPAKTDKSILPRNQMISLLTDIHIADGQMDNVASVNQDTLYKYGEGKYLAVFKKHHVDSTIFRKSVRYYAGKPEQFEAMYEEILKRLAAKTDSANKELLKTNNGPRSKAYR